LYQKRDVSTSTAQLLVWSDRDTRAAPWADRVQCSSSSIAIDSIRHHIVVALWCAEVRTHHRASSECRQMRQGQPPPLPWHPHLHSRTLPNGMELRVISNHTPQADRLQVSAARLIAQP
jgi:hypothetical protein